MSKQKIQTNKGIVQVESTLDWSFGLIELFIHKNNEGYQPTLKFDGLRIGKSCKTENEAKLSAEKIIANLGLRKIATLCSIHPFIDPSGRLVSHRRSPGTTVLNFYAAAVRCCIPYVGTTVVVDELQISGIERKNLSLVENQIRSIFKEWEIELVIKDNRYAPMVKDFVITLIK